MSIRLGSNELCWCGGGKKYKRCHCALDETIDSYWRQGYLVPKRDMIKNQAQIDAIRASGKINTAILDFIADKLYIGMPTQEIDTLVYEKTIALGGIPATLHYEGYPKSVCVSINEQVCHGIPSEDVYLQEGDIVNIDVTTKYKGYFADSSRMFCIGAVTEENRKLVEVAKECMLKGLEQVKPWTQMGNMSQAVQDYAKKHGYTVVKDVGGHGVGIQFHEDPWVSYIMKKETGILLVPGMIFTIEPMINMGASQVFIDEENEWTIYTADNKPSAQWEMTVLVTEDGYEVLAY